MDSDLGLAVVGGRANKVHRYLVGSDVVGEMEDRGDMALSWKGDHHHNYLLVLESILITIFTSLASHIWSDVAFWFWDLCQKSWYAFYNEIELHE